MKTNIKEYVKSLQPHHIEKSIPEIEKELGISVVQMGSNINPTGPSPFALKAIFDNMGEIHHYPNSTAQPLREAIAKKYSVSLDQVLTGNGVSEITQDVLNVHTCPGDQVVCSIPTSLAFLRVAKAAGLNLKPVDLTDTHHYNLKEMLQQIDEKTKVVYLVNPHNPMGTAISHTELEDFISKVPDHVLVMMDESAIEFATEEGVHSTVDLVDKYSNLLVLRTFSIIYGLAGLRCGYALGPAELLEYVRRVSPSYCVNFLAQVGCAAALADDDYVERTREANKVNREIMETGLKKLARYQLTWVPSQSNFITVFLPILGDQFSEELLKGGFRVRSLSKYGLDNGVRISIGTRPDTIRSVYAMARVLKDLLGGEH